MMNDENAAEMIVGVRAAAGREKARSSLVEKRF